MASRSLERKICSIYINSGCLALSGRNYRPAMMLTVGSHPCGLCKQEKIGRNCGRLLSAVNWPLPSLASPLAPPQQHCRKGEKGVAGVFAIKAHQAWGVWRGGGGCRGGR